MRVRYQIAGEPVKAKCDMTKQQAKKLFNELKTDGICEWAELIGEDDDNYMDVLESFDNIRQAQAIKRMFGDLVSSRH